ncbi:MAG: helix-turn-helix transcriptional regulator [Clostridiales bacterium]|nr:helix-turn-helix transcriptional regulator [Clostridiales bacterium]
MDYNELIIKRITELCKRRGISYNKLAQMSDLHQSTVDNIVRGNTKNPRIITLHHIALGFGMTISEFLDFNQLNDFSFDDDENEE